MHDLRTLLTSLIGAAVTGIAFVIAATFGLALIALVTIVAFAGLVVVKAVPMMRSTLVRVRLPGRARGVWRDDRGIVVDA